MVFDQINKCVAEVWPNGKRCDDKIRKMEPSNLRSSIVFGKAVVIRPVR